MQGQTKMEETLDPQDWQAMAELGRRMVDDMVQYLKTVGDGPVWRHAPEEVKAHFSQSLPQDPQPAEQVYQEFLNYVLPYPVGNVHPRFWGWVIGTGTISGAFAEFLAAVMNTNTGGLDHHAANHVEKQLIQWFREIFAFPAGSSGVLTSGCSAANLIALAVARNSKAEGDLRRQGLQGVKRRMTLYGSEEIHSSLQKAVELLGLGSDSLRTIGVDQDFRIDTAKLEEAISSDRQKGHLPFCVIGAAGTTNTGASDDLHALADISEREGLWFHVDGAFGAWAILAPSGKAQVAGIERADSLALDLHKWMYMPYEIGCILVRDEQKHRSTFSLTPAYLAHGEGGRGLTGGDLPWFSDYHIQLSRGFRALKAWMSLKEHGLRKYGRLIEQNILQARYLGDLVEKNPQLELAAPIMLNVVCFRFVGEGEKRSERDERALDDLNREILTRLQEEGTAVPSGTSVRGRYYLHLAITNHRSRKQDFDLLLREVLRIGGDLQGST
ncbi:MAG: aminotransferase class V-fold PLP-dependent enzyme [Spirochaetaceae bacterium]|nr:MAG: aminotransferase class V-fold PLP-dependent enzyme [Spirochaetaceae bacterium]